MSATQKRYRPSHPSDAAEALARPAKGHRGDSLTPNGVICDRGLPVTPTRGDLARPPPKFHTWNKERTVGTHETATDEHEWTHRNYESGILRVSGSVAAPACTATLLEDRRGATGPRLPQGCSAYISHERWKGTAPSVLPADGCALPPSPGQIQHLPNSPLITDSYHSISKSDIVFDARMFAGISSSTPLYAEHPDAYVDFSLAPVECRFNTTKHIPAAAINELGLEFPLYPALALLTI
ncbi:hypothetical protein NM688_g8063 [Phlebia brevispora]|uniref:Uncharacterized protein n=1 Tax=Phlebia brevispora TaxID=194682 RepID=A0ACC1RXS6_9APHY|nr:hypothetical protein NM688_g8063 [Phlebia brevispora]